MEPNTSSAFLFSSQKKQKTFNHKNHRYFSLTIQKVTLIFSSINILLYLCITIDFINMQKEQEHILAAIRECLAKNMPANGKAILFGSQARGTAREDSDWDILIILDKEELLPADYDNITYPLTMLGWNLEKEINPVMYSAKELQKFRNTAFCKNLEREGIRLV